MLNIKNLRKSFTNSNNETFNVINIPEFILEDSELLAISGDSGSGKSTFLSLISGIISPDMGEITINGTDITKLSESKKDLFRAKHISYIFQSFNLLQGFNALENVMIGMMFHGKADRKKSADALAKAGLSGKLFSRPPELSVGEQQRVAVARAIVNKPVLLLADEPTANLDPLNSQSVTGIIKNLCSESNISLIIVTHERNVISEFSNVREFSEINKAAGVLINK
ncbi:MAG: ABC transporter ATP-binding protein [Ignavibacteria bacterium]|nr:ABC transporter ATP-binding protein [Ignavibacteria bacterium]